jgi:hypothetical protein
VYYLTEAAYGASLSGVTGNIVTTLQNTANLCSVAAYDLDADARPCASVWAFISSATGTDLTAKLTTAEECFAVSVASSAGNGAAALTYTQSTLTEDADAGGSNGTRCGQISFAHGSLGIAVDTTVGATVSGTINAGAAVVTSFRGVIDGE